jgi:hypothetical protein
MDDTLRRDLKLASLPASATSYVLLVLPARTQERPPIANTLLQVVHIKRFQRAGRRSAFKADLSDVFVELHLPAASVLGRRPQHAFSLVVSAMPCFPARVLPSESADL